MVGECGIYPYQVFTRRSKCCVPESWWLGRDTPSYSDGGKISKWHIDSGLSVTLNVNVNQTCVFKYFKIMWCRINYFYQKYFQMISYKIAYYLSISIFKYLLPNILFKINLGPNRPGFKSMRVFKYLYKYWLFSNTCQYLPSVLPNAFQYSNTCIFK